MRLIRPRSIARPLVLALALSGVPTLALATSAGTASATPYCGIHWGSLTKSVTRSTTSSVMDVRSGRHACFDRLVIDLTGSNARSGFSVKYVNTVRADGSGKVVPLRGGARLAVVVAAPTYNAFGNPTYTPASRTNLVDVQTYSTFRQVSLAGSFEGRTTIGLGVRARLPFRVFTLAGVPNGGAGTRVVIDVAHHW